LRPILFDCKNDYADIVQLTIASSSHSLKIYMCLHTSTLFGEKQNKKTTPKRKITEERKKENKIRSNAVQTKLDLSVRDDTSIEIE
jgi:hypothetical protein